MSTDTDSAPPSMSPSSPDGAGGRRGAERDADPSWLQQEIQRRIAANGSGRRGRHAASDDAEPYVPPTGGGTPRHAVPAGPPPRPTGPPSSAEDGPAPPEVLDGARMPPRPASRPRSADDVPAERAFAPAEVLPATGPLRALRAGGLRRRTSDFAVPEQRRSDEPLALGTPVVSERVRVVLSERRRAAKPMRTVDVVQEGTGVGQLLRSSLIRSQLTVALWFTAAATLSLGALPLLFAIFPGIGRAEVFGLRVPWLLLGVLVYPFLAGLGWWHTRAAERVEQNFADHVQV